MSEGKSISSPAKTLIMISVLTPTYNRALHLNRAYQSLVNQNCKDFEWIVIDDGSSDNTTDTVDRFISESLIEIKYIKKTNGGKHTALNVGVREACGDLIIILDSDDWLSNDAIEIIYKHKNLVNLEYGICGLCFLKMYSDKTIVGDSFKEEVYRRNNIDLRYFDSIKGDKEEVFLRKILLQYPFPEFDKERFISEAIVWNRISIYYDMYFINKSIYYCEYLPDGLSSNQNLFISNPKGTSLYANELTLNRFPLKQRIRSVIDYVAYSLLIKKKANEIMQDSLAKPFCIILFPIGLLKFLVLNKKSSQLMQS